MDAERLANLGYFSPPAKGARDESLMMPPPKAGGDQIGSTDQQKSSNVDMPIRHGTAHDISAEPSAEERLKHPKKFLGFNHAHEVLPFLGLNFSALQTSISKSQGRPVLDMGSSLSTIAVEGWLRNIEFFSADFAYTTKNLPRVIHGIMQRTAAISHHYTNTNKTDPSLNNPGGLPAAFEPSPISAASWNETLFDAATQLIQRMLSWDASKIPMPNQYFSTVFSHQAVPKYCDRNKFFSTQLPELLRVTHDRLHLFPLVTAGPGDPLIHVPGSEGRKQLEEIARANGFTLEVKVAPNLVGVPVKDPGFNMLGIFVRRNNCK